ncbi:MAG: NUDIX domain-containing protein, partial [Pseudomonadota bacterium]
KEKAKPKPQRSGHVFLLIDEGELFLERRPEKGLLGGMLGLPGSDWVDGDVPACSGAPVPAPWASRGEVRHVFTHFALTLQVWQGVSPEGKRPNGIWVPLADVDGLPSVFAKAVRLAA